VLRDLGADIDFWKVALRPGKPMLSGRLGGMRIVGLPGNPVSAFVCAFLFVVPLLRRLGGDPAPRPPLFAATLGEALPANGPRQDYLRAVATAGPVVVAASRQDSGMLGVLARSNALIVRAPHAPAADAGETMLCHALDFVPGVA
jgi:molybdopterin molybdotransferase